jgi:hypothetical protein
MKKNVGQQGLVSGFSKKTKAEKIAWISAQFANPQQATELLETYTHPDPKTQNLHDEFIENAVANFYLPLGVAPNFIINGKTLTIPMAIEESSVVAAASNAAKFWADKGGFTAVYYPWAVHFLANPLVKTRFSTGNLIGISFHRQISMSTITVMRLIWQPLLWRLLMKLMSKSESILDGI